MELTKGKVFIFSAPSGSGKTTIVRHVLDRYPNFEFSISATTRPARSHERHGVHYYFLNVEDFINQREAGAFLEWEEVYPGKYYGSLKSEVERIRAKGHHVAFDVDVKGGLNIKRYYGEQAVCLFIQAPSIAELRKRLHGRATEGEAEIELRCQKAKEELKYAPQFDHVIVNDELEAALEKVFAIIERHTEGSFSDSSS